MAGLKASAIKLMSVDTAKIQALTKDQIKAIAQDARKAFNGATMKALADSSLDKVKAALGCAGDVKKCPAALTDITVTYDLATKKASDILTEIKAALKAAGQPDYSTCVGSTIQNCIQVLQAD